MEQPDPTGFLNLYKPFGMTSHDCVGEIRRVFKTRKVGHGGTLDPAATGVLPIAVGKATRFLTFLSGEKRYQATFQFGKTSTTDDATGDLLNSQPCSSLSLDQIQTALTQFHGSIEQVPPIYSAIRRDGVRLYELARLGATLEDLKVSPRAVIIHSLRILAWRPGDFPEVDLEVYCGPGTYIRAIARDLGQCLGCGGLMSALIRTQSGPFKISTSVTLEDLKTAKDPYTKIQSLLSGFQDWTVVTIDPQQTYRWQCGQMLTLEELALDPSQCSELICVQTADQIFLGIGRIETDHIKALRVSSY